MSQINSINSTYSMFKMPQNIMTAGSQSQSAPSAVVSNAPAQIISGQNNTPAPQTSSFGTENTNEEKKPLPYKKIAVAAVIAAGIAIGLKTGKIQEFFKKFKHAKPDAVPPKAPPVAASAPELQKTKYKLAKPPKIVGARFNNQSAGSLVSDPVLSAEQMAQKAREAMPKLPIGLPEKSSATIANELNAVQEAKDLAVKAEKRAQKWKEKGAKLGAEAQTKEPLPKVIALGTSEPIIREPLANPPAPQPEKQGHIGLGVAAFVAALGVKGTSTALKSSKDKEIEDLKAALAKNQDYIKNTEIPGIMAESAKYSANYREKIINAIEKLEASADDLRKRMESTTQAYYSLNSKKEDYWQGTDIPKHSIIKDEKDIKNVMFSRNKEGKVLQKTIFSKGVPVQAEIFDPSSNKLIAKARFMVDKETSNLYMSHYFKYDPKTGVASGTLVFDADNNARVMLSRDREGKLRKVFDINSKTLDLNAVALPDESGKRCTKRYEYDKNGIITEAKIYTPAHGLPRRNYDFEEGVVKSIDLFGKKNKPLLHQPLEA